MRKILLFVCGIMMISSVAMAEETTVCANGSGEIVKGNDGTEYCKSRIHMNWWTALGWCQKIGRVLVRYPLDCSCEGDKCPNEMVHCPNLKGVGIPYVWTSTLYGNDNALCIHLESGKVINDHAGRHNKNIALCK